MDVIFSSLVSCMHCCIIWREWSYAFMFKPELARQSSINSRKRDVTSTLTHYFTYCCLISSQKLLVNLLTLVLSLNLSFHHFVTDSKHDDMTPMNAAFYLSALENIRAANYKSFKIYFYMISQIIKHRNGFLYLLYNDSVHLDYKT